MTNSIAAPAAFDASLISLRNRDVAAVNPQAIEATAKEFEGMFISEMLSHMFEGIETDPAFGGGHGEDMFKSLLVSEYGKMVAKGPGLGISDQIKQMMIQMQQQKKDGE